MGILDRDYMRRPPDDPGRSDSPPDFRTEEWAASFLRKNPKFLLYCVAGLGVLILTALIVAYSLDTGR
jgi:hypothetical protein